MSSIRPLATITLLACVGVVLYMKINETEPQLPAEMAVDWASPPAIEMELGADDGAASAPAYAALAPQGGGLAPSYAPAAAAAPAPTSPGASSAAPMWNPGAAAPAAATVPPATDPYASAAAGATPERSVEARTAPAVPDVPELPDLPPIADSAPAPSPAAAGAAPAAAVAAAVAGAAVAAELGSDAPTTPGPVAYGAAPVAAAVTADASSAAPASPYAAPSEPAPASRYDAPVSRYDAPASRYDSPTTPYDSPAPYDAPTTPVDAAAAETAAAPADDTLLPTPLRQEPASTGSSLFATAWLEVQAALDRGELSHALLKLSDWRDDPSLTPEQTREVKVLLSQLAGSVIYEGPPAHRLESPYRVQAGETLIEVGERFQVPWQLLAKINGIEHPSQVQPGQELKVVRGPFSAVIDLSRRELTLMLERRYAGQFALEIAPSTQLEEGQWKVDQKLLTPSAAPAFGGAPTLGEDRSMVLARVGAAEGQSAPAVLRGPGNADPAAIQPQGRMLRLSARDIEDVYDILSVGSRVTIRR